MQPYQFEKIYSQMGKEFGKLKSGQEDNYSMMLFPIESNALKIHRKYPASDSRRMREAIALALFDIKARYTGEMIPLDQFRTTENAKLENAILMAFDPFTNSDIYDLLKTDSNLKDLAFLRNYYTDPIKCLLRIKDSIDTWEKRMGSNGYFLFLEKAIGAQISGDDLCFSLGMQKR